jgi:hypothetical protein
LLPSSSHIDITIQAIEDTIERERNRDVEISHEQEHSYEQKLPMPHETKPDDCPPL